MSMDLVCARNRTLRIGSRLGFECLYSCLVACSWLIKSQESSIWMLRMQESMKRINMLNSDSTAMVDRRIVVKLLVTYFQRSQSPEILDLMSRMLHLTGEHQEPAFCRLLLFTRATRKCFSLSYAARTDLGRQYRPCIMTHWACKLGGVPHLSSATLAYVICASFVWHMQRRSRQP